MALQVNGGLVAASTVVRAHPSPRGPHPIVGKGVIAQAVKLQQKPAHLYQTRNLAGLSDLHFVWRIPQVSGGNQLK